MNIVDGLQEVAKIATRCFQHFVVAEIGEESYKTFAEKVHEIVKRFTSEGRQGFGQVGHETVRIDLAGNCLRLYMLEYKE